MEAYASPFIFGAIWILAYLITEFAEYLNTKFTAKITAFYRLFSLKRREKHFQKELKQKINQIKAVNKAATLTKFRYNLNYEYFMKNGRVINEKQLNLMAERCFELAKDNNCIGRLNEIN